MKTLILVVLCALYALAQDTTVDWKLSVTELERGLPAAASDTWHAEATWRAEAETLRSSLAEFAARHPDYELHVPEALGSGASGDVSPVTAGRSGRDQKPGSQRYVYRTRSCHREHHL
jgi:hypothetical protein